MSKLLTPEEELKLCKDDAKWVPQLVRAVMTAAYDSPWDTAAADPAFLEWLHKRHAQLEERDV